MENHPVLYSYRRCPYAMRARMAIAYSGVQVEQREIVFWDKPEHMLAVSPKGTVPVLVLPDGTIIDESRDIMVWALNQISVDSESDHTPQGGIKTWLFEDEALNQQIADWIDECDDVFKTHLDHYKYADRFPEHSKEYYRDLGCEFLNKVEQTLSTRPGEFETSKQIGLIANQVSMADIAVFPFIRQFVNVDKIWFSDADYPFLTSWLEHKLELSWFNDVMKNRPVWVPGHNPLWVIEPGLQTKDQFRHKAGSLGQ